MATDGETSHGLDNAGDKARSRLSSLEDWLDPATIRHLSARGIGARWRCLEVGRRDSCSAGVLHERCAAAAAVPSCAASGSSAR